jgi:hypothetical protein
MKLLTTAALLLASLPLATPAACPTKPQYKSCGGMSIEANRCPSGHECISDPRTGGCGLACDQPGICVPTDAPKCGGFAGFQCPEKKGYRCYDDPRDNCDPSRGCRDNMGICL